MRGSRPNILLVTIDTLRADHLSVYGYERQTSPFLDRLASEGVRFASATVQWPKTGPSFASMLTATYPSDNGIVRHVGIELPCEFRMLAEILQEQGYSSHAVVSNGAVASELLYDQGFDSFIDTWKMEVPEGVDPNGAGFVTDQALEALGRFAPDKPYFLWVHYLDPHHPYAPPEPYRDRFQDDAFFDPTEQISVADNPNQQMVQVGYRMVLDGRTELDFYRARYDAEIAYADSQVERLLGGMEERGLLEKTLTVMTSDHGESLGEHYFYFDHGRFAFNTCQEVPLIMHYPGALEPRVVDSPVPLIDLMPTLLEVADIELEQGRYLQGHSLVPLLLGEEREEREIIFGEAGMALPNWQHSARQGKFKLIYAPNRSAQRFVGGVGNAFVLYDTEADPGETKDVKDQHPEIFESLRKELWLHTRDEPFNALIDTSIGTCRSGQGLDAETESQLKALGYL
ncbi:MAG: sulfatase [Acidobacteriota bacterium]